MPSAVLLSRKMSCLWPHMTLVNCNDLTWPFLFHLTRGAWWKFWNGQFKTGNSIRHLIDKTWLTVTKNQLTMVERPVNNLVLKDHWFTCERVRTNGKGQYMENAFESVFWAPILTLSYIIRPWDWLLLRITVLGMPIGMNFSAVWRGLNAI